MLKASSKSSPDVISRNVVSAFDHSLSSAADRFAHIWNPDKMQLDSVASPLRFLENFHVSPAAQSRFKRKCFLSIYQSAHFTEEKLSSFERDSPVAMATVRARFRQYVRSKSRQCSAEIRCRKWFCPRRCSQRCVDCGCRHRPQLSASRDGAEKTKFVSASCRCNGREATARLSNQQASRVCSPDFLLSSLRQGSGSPRTADATELRLCVNEAAGDWPRQLILFSLGSMGSAVSFRVGGVPQCPAWNLNFTY